MRTIILGLAVVAALIPAPARADILISNDPGGNLHAYQSRVEGARTSGERVVISGRCNSACTLWLTLPRSQVCGRGRVVFGFHAATNSDMGLPNPRETYALWSSYPDAVKVAVGSRGGLSWVPVSVPGGEVLRPCR